MTKIYDLIVVGSGPAGMTAALYASRANLDTLIIERELPGGQMNNTGTIENYIGFPSIEGADLSEKMYEHSMSFGATEKMADVLSIEKLENSIFCAHTTRGDFHAKTVIIATGTYNRKLNVPGEEELSGLGVSYCAICDGPLFEGGEVVVVGGGDSALQESLYLTKFCNTVHLLHRRGKFRAKPELQAQVLTNEKIRVYYDTTLTDIVGQGKVESASILATELNTSIKIDGVFIYVGQIPQTGFLSELNILDENGFVKVDERFETSIPGLFAVGDILDKEVRQIANAVGDGAVAAQNLTEYVKVYD